MFDKLPIVARMAEMVRADPVLMGIAIVATIVFVAVVVCLAEARQVQR